MVAITIFINIKNNLSMKNQKAILLRLSNEDDQFIKQEAEKMRMTKSGYLRYIAITQKL
tara:strand:- start:184 stop:360 length:177 start_codon:yes stop_codon:yes gene_type:complete